jgi:ribosomal protein L31
VKTDIHPTYDVTEVDLLVRQPVRDPLTKPGELHVELCNECHPFFTGQAEAGRQRRTGRALPAGATATSR